LIPRVSDHPLAANNGVAVDADGERAMHLFTTLSYRDFTFVGLREPALEGNPDRLLRDRLQRSRREHGGSPRLC